MEKLFPPKIVEEERGIRATFPDGHTATVTLDGKWCTCFSAWGGHICPHIKAVLDKYAAWKWKAVEEHEELREAQALHRLGIDMWIFYPPHVDWNEEEAGTDLVWFRLMQKQSGWVFRFKDGAFFALVDGHPHGMTMCSQCRSRDCWHVKVALEEHRLSETVGWQPHRSDFPPFSVGADSEAIHA